MRSNIIRRCYGFSSGYSSSSTNATTIRHTMGSVQPLATSVLPVVSTSSSLSTSVPSPVALQDPTAQAYYPPTAIPLTGSSHLHIPPSQGATINTTTTALAEPVVPRVFAWYRPDAPFDMQRVHELLSARGIEPGCVYPPIISSTHVASSSSSTTAVGGGGGAATSSKSHPGSQHHHHHQHQRLGSSAMAAAKSVRTVSSWKQVEVLGFTIPTKPADATGKPGAITVQTTYFVFADGGLVGWNATWDELVWMRGILLAGNGSTSTTTTTSPPVASTSVAGTCTTSDILSRSPQQQPTTTTSPTTTAAPLWSSSVGHNNKLASSMTAVESMRYQLFWTLPMAERPHDSEQEPSTYIDAVKDRIVLEDDADIGMKLPYSVALLHSVKLDAMHHALEPVASLVKRWQQHLSMDGELVCTIKDLRKAKTNLLNLMEALNAQLYAQATPKLFWSGTYHNVRGHYRDACVHLEVEDRASSIKAQMESMDESLSYLHDESHASENEWLTWVIIGLIAMEVMVALGVLESLMGWLFELLVFGGESTPHNVQAAKPTTAHEEQA